MSNTRQTALIGDIVIRKIGKNWSLEDLAAKKQRDHLGHGIVLNKQMAGTNPRHMCLTVWYPKTGDVWDIAESLVEVLGASR